MLDPSLDGWSARDHLAHLTVWDEIRGQEIARISDGGEPAWPPTMTGPQIETFNNLIADLRPALSVAQVQREPPYATRPNGPRALHGGVPARTVVLCGSPTRTRTSNTAVNSRVLYH